MLQARVKAHAHCVTPAYWCTQADIHVCLRLSAGLCAPFSHWRLLAPRSPRPVTRYGRDAASHALLLMRIQQRGCSSAGPLTRLLAPAPSSAGIARRGEYISERTVPSARALRRNRLHCALQQATRFTVASPDCPVKADATSTHSITPCVAAGRSFRIVGDSRLQSHAPCRSYEQAIEGRWVCLLLLRPYVSAAAQAAAPLLDWVCVQMISEEADVYNRIQLLSQCCHAQLSTVALSQQVEQALEAVTDRYAPVTTGL